MNYEIINIKKIYLNYNFIDKDKAMKICFPL